MHSHLHFLLLHSAVPGKVGPKQAQVGVAVEVPQQKEVGQVAVAAALAVPGWVFEMVLTWVELHLHLMEQNREVGQS